MTMPGLSEPRVKFLRIDDRFIHGQVIVGWLPTLRSERILVVNERIAQDSMRQEMMGLSLPPTVELSFIAPIDINDSIRPGFETLLLVSSPEDAWTCLEGGLIPEQLNIGGMHAKPGKKELLEALHVSEEDRVFFRKIIDAGIAAVFQPTPQNEPILMGDIL